MNTQKILELLGTTSDKKMETLKREMTFPATAEESANDLLNAELYGTKKAAVETVRKSIVRKPVKKAMESAESSSVIPAPFDKYYDVVSSNQILDYYVKNFGFEEEDLSEPPIAGKNGIFGVEDLPSYRGLKHIAWLLAKPQYQERLSAEPYDVIELVEDNGKKCLYLTYSMRAMDVGDDILRILGGSESSSTESVNQGGRRFDACPKEAQDFLFKLLDVISSGDCRKAKRMLLQFIGMVPASSTEMVVEAQTENFPSTFDFDEEKFAEDYDIDKDSITCIHIAEDPEAKIEEHIEVSFKAVEDGEESTVVLSIAPDMLVSETIDAEVIEPAQFSASFVEEENEQGETRTRLVLTLVDDDEDDEETDVVMSEGDAEHVDENGDATTDEFIEEAGLNLDPFYSKQHNIKVAGKGAHESLATKIIRSRK